MTQDATPFEWPPPHIPLSEKEREACGAELKRRYETSSTPSIRALMDECGRSYGFVQRALKTAGTQLAPRGNRAVEGLSPRPAQVLRLIAEGSTTGSIARDLGVTPGVIRIHLAQALRKTTGSGKGIWARPAAVETAYATGLLPRPARLTGRVDLPDGQRELIPLLARGLTPDQIAAALHCRRQEAVGELKALERALGAATPAHVITRARQYGLPTSAEIRTSREESR
ncbi:helix-turn-helix domain-containing protein [Streptomyces sp. NPDC004539]|uniref:helix-turn-helix domain-containing protein n=1 Tax=Streptomyces sp. NPDC004539 TaxID=3154280 RepID=UPI0033B6EED9